MHSAASEHGRSTAATPEDLFLAWFLRLPHTADIAEAARIEIARLNTLETISDTTHRLKIMLELASHMPAHVAHSNRRRSHH